MELKYNKALMHTKTNLLCSNNLITSFGENEHSCLLHSHHCLGLPSVIYHHSHNEIVPIIASFFHLAEVMVALSFKIGSN